ncbi:hypothetical protein SAMN04515665_10424 [Blastococcus sp. DSM 46786]|uniref:hypothetical protein n=1 Tax=Blastococcus sp. DSM 46786 TaxID=1798227 RepID=UPI0008D0D9F5|nr:hypothetical protein [Blastococcus sp. DSM 46786]SEK65223.1 hypothetical protein SAMN04515665_10424 [Blastococcus sp. DSM 46786]
MAYDALAESIALIERGVPEAPPRLSRRRRFAALAVDVDGDVACTLFARRSVGYVAEETWVLVRRGQEWVLLGGGGSGFEDDDLADRPDAAALSGQLLLTGSGSVLRNGGRSLPWGARYVSYARVRASREVDRLVVGARRLAVPRHGHLVVVWAGRRPPTAEALARDGRRLESRRLDLRSPRLPEVYRDPG